jgi:hypothetical protein
MLIESILLESQALSEVLRCVEGNCATESAKKLTKEVLSSWVDNDEGLLELVLQCAMSKVVGNSLPTIEEFPKRFPRALPFVETSREWLSWVTGTSIPEAPLFQEDSSGAIQNLALTYWSGAVESLLREDSQAQRLFRRATEFSSSYGVFFNQAIQWTYAASFFPTT